MITRPPEGGISVLETLCYRSDVGDGLTHCFSGAIASAGTLFLGQAFPKLVMDARWVFIGDTDSRVCLPVRCIWSCLQFGPG